ncbi:MAG: lytic transglycosylase domain-containing protein [Bacteroidia bacterium]
MPKSIFEVEVNDAALDRLVAKMKKFTDAQERAPKAWRKLGEDARKFGETIDENAKRTERARKEQERTNSALGRGAGAARGFSTEMGKAAASTGQVLRHAVGITHQLFRWASLGGIASGLLGAGSLWGLGRMAEGAGQVRRTSQGLGLVGGQLQAFQTNYAKAVDPRELLGNIQASRNDPNRQWAFHSMGMGDFAGRSNFDLATSSLIQAKRIFEEGGKNTQYAEARGLTNFFSIEDLQRLSTMTDEEIHAMQRRAQQDEVSFRVSDRLRQSWQALATQFERAATTIESGFLRVLGPLAPELEKLSEAFVKAVGDIATTERIRDAITFVADGIKAGAAYLTSDKFKEDMKAFGDGIEDIWKAIQRVVRWINGVFGSGDIRIAPGGIPLFERREMPLATDGEQHGALDTGMVHLARFGIPGGTGRVYSDTPRGQGTWDSIATGTAAAGGGGAGSDVVAAAERARGLPTGLLDGIWNIESGRGRNMGPSRAGARGHFQFMPGTARQYGIEGQEGDLSASAGAAGAYMSDLLRMFGGDVAKAVAGYNWGQGNVQRLVRERGDNWRQGLPAETSAYLERLFGARASQPIVIQIANLPAGSVVQGATAAAVQR